MIVNDFKPILSSDYYCKCCDYSTSKKSNFDNHKLSAKHKKSTIVNVSNGEISKISSKYACKNCNKVYKDNSGLWRHSKKCIKKDNDDSEQYEMEEEKGNSDFKMLAELFKQQMNENKELKELLLEQNKQIIELSKEKNTIINNNTTNNTNNNQFNLQFFLNEQCKDALNLGDFVEQITLQLSDLDMIGRVGYVEGMSKIFLRNLKALDVFKRPIHCSDLKRETLYIKDKDSWEKENGENIKITRAIKEVEHKNIKQIPKWREENPTAEDTETKKHMEYQNILLEAMGGSTMEDDAKKREKIIRNIAKEVVIEKKSEK
jgi:hypothetical protein